MPGGREWQLISRRRSVSCLRSCLLSTLQPCPPPLPSTDRDGTAENIGERIDDAAREAGDRIEDAADEVQEAAGEIGDALRDR